MLFATDQYVLGNAEDPRRIVIDDERRAALFEIFREGQGRAPDEDEIDKLIIQWTQNEILYREALLMGLDKGDEMIRQRLILKIRNLLFNRVTTETPSEAELKAWFEDNRAAYDKPVRYDFEQFLLPRPEDGSDAELKAVELAKELGSAPPPEEYLNLVRRYHLRPGANLLSAFGTEQGQKLIDGRDNIWLAVHSDQGWHLARITRRLAAKPADFEKIRTRVATDWKDAAARKQLAIAVKEIADQYELKLEFGRSSPLPNGERQRAQQSSSMPKGIAQR